MHEREFDDLMRRLEEEEDGNLSRRDLLRRGGVLGLGLAALGDVRPCRRAGAQSRVASARSGRSVKTRSTSRSASSRIRSGSFTV
jgi:hypothetical protein